jgi:hypothetical protein
MLIRLQFKPILVQWHDFSCIQQTNLWKICYGDSLFIEHLDGFLSRVDSTGIFERGNQASPTLVKYVGTYFSLRNKFRSLPRFVNIIIHGILAAMRYSFFSAEDGGVSGTQSNSKGQAISLFDEVFVF